MPSTMRANGRRALWSMKYSVSNVARTSVWMVLSIADIAVLAPRPASIQPSRQTTSTGSFNSGSARKMMRS